MGVVKRQGIKNTISSYIGILLGFVSLVIIQPRFLNPEEIGLARVLLNFSIMVGSVIPLGINLVTVKYFPVFKNEKNGHHGFLGFILLFLVAGFLISMAVLLLFKEIIMNQFRRESPLVIEYFYYILPFSFFLGLTNVLNNYLISLLKSTITSYLNDIFVRVGYIILIIVYYFKYISLSQFIMGYVAVYGLQTLIQVMYMVQVDKPSLKIDWSFLRKQGLGDMIRFGLLLSCSSAASLGLKNLDAVLLGKFMALEYVGIYSVVAFIPIIIETPLTALERITAPKMAQAYSAFEMEELKDIFYKSVKYLTVIGGLLFVGVNTNIEYLLHFIGKDYAAATGVVYIISIGSMMTMLGGSSNPLLVYTSKPWQGALMLVVLVFVTFILNFILIPRFGINGAALSTAISAFLFTASKFIMNYRRFGFQPYNSTVFKIALAMAVCIAVNYFLPNLHSDVYNILLRGVLLSGIYAALIYYFQILPELNRYIPWHST